MEKSNKVKNNIRAFFKKIDEGLDRIYQWFRKLLMHHGYLLFAIFLSICALALRYVIARFPSHDDYAFIFPWIKNFRENGHLAYLKVMQGDYPPLYMTFLALISYLPAGREITSYAYNYPLYDMMYVKTFSFIFDFLMAYGFYKIVRLKNPDQPLLSFIAYIVPLFLSTVLINSAFWGQCDAIYVSLVVWSIYFILKEKPWVSSIFLGLAFAFKLQTVFIIPFYGYLWLRKKFKLRYFLLSFMVVFLTFIPCYIAGAPFLAPFEKYGNLTVEYMNPNYNSGSLYTFLSNIKVHPDHVNETYELIHYGGIFFGLAMSFFTLFIFFKKQIRASMDACLAIGAFYALLVPFVLPHMHERYFFMADILIVLYCLGNKKKYGLIFVSQLASLITLMPYIFESWFIPSWGSYSLRIATLLNLGMLVVIFKDILSLPTYSSELEDVEKNLQDVSL